MPRRRASEMTGQDGDRNASAGARAITERTAFGLHAYPPLPPAHGWLASRRSFGGNPWSVIAGEPRRGLQTCVIIPCASP